MKNKNQKQVAAFDQVLGLCNDLGEMYNPSMESIKVTALTSMLTSAQESILAVDTAKNKLTQEIVARQVLFRTLPGIGTRILNAFQVTNAPPELVARIKLIRDRFRKASRSGQSAPAKPEDSSKAQPSSADSSHGPLSQLDFESKIRNFSTMIDLLEGESSYKPNEADITIAALKAMLATMRQQQRAVIAAKVALSEARLVRNEAVYGDSGICGSAKRVKKYILSIFGATSPQFLMFKSVRIKAR